MPLDKAPFAKTRAHSGEPFSGSPCAVLTFANGGCVGGRHVPEVLTSLTEDGTVVLHCGPDAVDPSNPSPGETFHLGIGLVCIN